MVEKRIKDIEKAIKKLQDRTAKLTNEFNDLDLRASTLQQQINKNPDAEQVSIKANQEEIEKIKEEREAIKSKIENTKKQIKEKEMDMDLITIACLDYLSEKCAENPNFADAEFSDIKLNEKYINNRGFIEKKKEEIKLKWQDLERENKYLKIFNRTEKGITERMREANLKSLVKDYKKEEEKGNSNASFEADAKKRIKSVYGKEIEKEPEWDK